MDPSIAPVVQSDYCIGIDREWTIDGSREAQRDAFCLAHINHSAGRSNLQRRTVRRQRKVAFVTARPIQVLTSAMCSGGFRVQ